MSGGDRQLPLIGDRMEWNLVSRTTVMGREIVGRRGRLSYQIPPRQFFIENSHVVLIGIRNPFAPGNWTLGGWATQSLLFEPSSTTTFTATALSSDRKFLRLGRLNLFMAPKLMPGWILELTFPTWHRQVDLEVWQYDGPDIDIFQRIAELETAVGDLLDSLDGGV